MENVVSVACWLAGIKQENSITGTNVGLYYTIEIGDKQNYNPFDISGFWDE